MSNTKEIIDSNERAKRRKRINRIKMIIIITIVIFLVLPTIFCCILFVKMNSLEKQIDVLKFMHDDEYSEAKRQLSIGNENIVYAAEEDSKEKDTLNESNESDNIKQEDIKNTEKDSLKKEEIAKEKTEKEVREKKEYSKKIYLTFDDGPSKNTEKILDILKEHNVKATFFVIGKEDEFSKKMYKRIVEEGHTLGMHSYSHKYSSIYKSLNSFKKDFKKISDLLYSVTGERPVFYRFPGGSSNRVSSVSMDTFIKYLNKEKITYFDWNVMNGDATSRELTKKELLKNVMTGVKLNDSSVVLMHDLVNKENTANVLSQVISNLKKEGYEILPIDNGVSPVQHIKAETVK